MSVQSRRRPDPHQRLDQPDPNLDESDDEDVSGKEPQVIVK